MIHHFFDTLWPRKNTTWPENDQPEGFLFVRIINKILCDSNISDGDRFMTEVKKNAEEGGFMPIFVAFGSELFIEYAQLRDGNDALLCAVKDGLQSWKTNKSIRFNEEITYLFGIGSKPEELSGFGFFASDIVQKLNLPTLEPEFLSIAKEYTDFRLYTDCVISKK